MLKNLESILNSLLPQQRYILLNLFSEGQLSIVLRYHNKLKGYPFFVELGTTIKYKKIFLDNLDNFKTAIGISDDEIKELYVPKNRWIDFELRNAGILAKLNPLRFAHLCRIEVGVDERHWFYNFELKYIIDKLGLEIVLINVPLSGQGSPKYSNHWNLITMVTNGIVYTSDPFSGQRQFPFGTAKMYALAMSQKLFDSYLQESKKHPEIIVPSRDRRLGLTRTRNYFELDFLNEYNYHLSSPYYKSIQTDGWNCGPLCIYAGLNSGKALTSSIRRIS